MKTLNNLFVSIYSVALIASLWFGINWIITRGISSMFDGTSEFILAVLYVGALVFSIIMHWKLKNKMSSVAQTTCMVVTAINTISLIGLIISAFTSGSDAGLSIAAWMFGVLALWFISLISGIVALKNK